MAMFAIGVAAATAQVATMNLSGSVPAELNGKKMYILKSATIIQYTIKGRFMSR